MCIDIFTNMIMVTNKLYLSPVILLQNANFPCRKNGAWFLLHNKSHSLQSCAALDALKAGACHF